MNANISINVSFDVKNNPTTLFHVALQQPKSVIMQSGTLVCVSTYYLSEYVVSV